MNEQSKWTDEEKEFCRKAAAQNIQHWRTCIVKREINFIYLLSFFLPDTPLFQIKCPSERECIFRKETPAKARQVLGETKVEASLIASPPPGCKLIGLSCATGPEWRPSLQIDDMGPHPVEVSFE